MVAVDDNNWVIELTAPAAIQGKTGAMHNQ